MSKKDKAKSLNSREKLTETSLKSKKWSGKAFQVRDTTLPGFFAEVNKTNTALKIQVDLWVGEPGRKKLERTVRHTIGHVGSIAVAEARMIATELINKIKTGQDPFSDQRAPAHHWSHGELLEAYIDECVERDLRDATINAYRANHKNLLSVWDRRPANSITKSDARDLFKRLSKNNGKIAANKAMRLMSAAHNWARKIDDYNEHFAINPIDGITLHTERGSKRSVLPEELPTWKRQVDALSNPQRRELHNLNLYSALRARTIMHTKREWIDFANHTIHYPEWAMKSRRDFDLPMSSQIERHVRNALSISEALYPNSPWLFTTWSRKRQEAIRTKVIRERKMPSLTGHILRKTHRTFAQRIRINKINGRLLLDHVVAGIDGVYVDDRALFDSLLEDQQAISNEIEKYLNM